MRQRGASIAELLVALAIGALLVAVAVPSFRYVIRSTRVQAAARQTLGDLRLARAQAIATGWQFKVVGFGNLSTSQYKNRYRIMARQSSTVAWPADNAPVQTTSTVRVEPWMDVGSNYPGVSIDPGGSSSNDRFEVVFDSRGAASMTSNDFNPIRFVGEGKPAPLTISNMGGISVQ